MGARGEGTICLPEAGEQQVLFTNRALMQAEKQMGKSVIGVSQGFLDGSAGINELVALLQAGMEAARRDSGERGRGISVNDAIAVLEDAGFTAVAQVVMEAVAAVLGYSAAADDEVSNSKNEVRSPA